MAYLIKNPPARSQFRSPRRMKPTGLIVVHTAESVMDTVGEDSGAENVAAFIRSRTDAPGSYHIICDSDSRIRLVPFTAEAYGDGTGSNLYAMHLSAACRTTDWAKMSKARRAGFVNQMARGAATYAKWLKKNHGITIPAKRVSREESSAGRPGFIGHGERDPGRRSDPGADFPWSEFLAEFDKHMGRGQASRDEPVIEALVEARKLTQKAVVALAAARRAHNLAANAADKAGRKPLAQKLVRRRKRLENQRKLTVNMRKFLNRNAVRLRSKR